MNVKILILISFFLLRSEAQPLDHLSDSKSGLRIYLDSKNWKEDHLAVQRVGKKLGFHLLFTPKNKNDFDHWRGVSVNFQRFQEPDDFRKWCPLNGVQQLPTQKGTQCIYKTQSGSKQIMFAVIRTSKPIPSSNKSVKQDFVRYITLVEQNPVSYREFIRWVLKSRGQL